MTTELVPISAEGFDIANAFLHYGSIKDTAEQLQLPQHEVARIVSSREVRRYLDTVYLDQGYRNRDKLASVLDKIIESKIAEAQESEIWSSKDLVDILQLAHKFRMDELKLQRELEKDSGVTINAQQNNYGNDAYGSLMNRLLGANDGN